MPTQMTVLYGRLHIMAHNFTKYEIFLWYSHRRVIFTRCNCVIVVLNNKKKMAKVTPEKGSNQNDVKLYSTTHDG